MPRPWEYKQAYTTSARQAPNSSIKDACADLRDLKFPTTGLARNNCRGGLRAVSERF